VEDLNGIMRKITGLLAKAEGTDNEHERQTFAAKAQELLQKYQLEEENLIAVDQFSILPIFRIIPTASIRGEFRLHHSWIWRIVAQHCGVRYVERYASGSGGYEAHTVGYDTDIRYAEVLFNAAKLVMIAKLEPSVNPAESDEDNVYRLRSAGIERNRIAQMMWDADLGQAGHSAHARVGRLYRAACEARDVDPAVAGRQVSAKTYREVFAREFVWEFQARLRQARDAADAVVGTLVPKGRQERVDEEFYTRFPFMRPAPEGTEEEEGTEKAGKPRKERALSKSTLARYDRLYASPTARAASASGREAAKSINLNRTPGANRLEEKSECDIHLPELPA
jgi:hypothetical protein